MTGLLIVLIAIPLIVFAICSGWGMMAVSIVGIFAIPIYEIIKLGVDSLTTDGSDKKSDVRRRLEENKRRRDIEQVKQQERYDNEWGILK